MFGKHFQLNEQTLSIVEEIGRHMPGGFFIYKAEQPQELIYVNHAVLDIFGCQDMQEFRNLTGYQFRGMPHPDDYATVSSSIQEQVNKNDDGFDYVEYRIIRKDGSIRWVDDYGHYTETEAYGGIYYVFISDITKKRMEMESDFAVRNAVIEALSKSYHTVWLINDVESEEFSLYRADADEDSVYSIPITETLQKMNYSQAKEYYINTTVAPEERERLHKELTMENIVSHLAEKSQWNVNYLRLMKDGSQRYFRIELAKMNMPMGKMGVVCGFKDVDEEVREEHAIQQALRDAQNAEEDNRLMIEKIQSEARQQELEQRLALQEQLLEEERQRAQQKSMITALASDYWSVYYIELEKDEATCYQTHEDIEDGFKVGEKFAYLKAFTNYAEKYIIDEYREEFMKFIQPDSIRDGLTEHRVISFRYMVHRHGNDFYEMVRFAGVRHPEDRDDHFVHAVGACFSNVDAETRRTLEQSHALEEALAVAQEANKAKTAFLSNMSHEIRTPMNAIIGLDNIALSDTTISQKTREYLQKINSSAQHLLNIINDILDMSRIESGRMTLKNEEFSFSKALEQINTIISGQCKEKGILYECRIKGNIKDYYIGDHMKLQQILINILGNAVKFTPSGGNVSFIIEALAQFEKKSTIRFVIRDNGIGMSKEYLPKLFDTFSQEDSSATSKYGSTGLGMPITKSLVELMNGNIEVESEKGKGTTFTVTVTLTDSERRPSQPENGQLRPEEMTVLVIDDDPVACEHAEVVLRQVGISCDSAFSGAEGLQMVEMRHARREPYHLILVDWKMPEMDGIETVRKIRSVVGNEMAIIILTSYNWDDVADEAKRAGVDTFVPKPLFASTIMDEFTEAFRKKNEKQNAVSRDLTGMRILLAEDVKVNAEIMKMILSMRGMKVDMAENGEIAVELFSSHEPDYYSAILMDMRMPVMDGLEATRTIRAMERNDAGKIPIIALTANAFDEDVQRSMQAGLNAHLSKPVQPDILFRTLESLIQKK